MSAIQPTLTDNQISTITDYVNAYRAKNQAPPLKWDSTIALFAQQWSAYLLTNNLFQHSNTQLYGENLAMLQGYGSDPVVLMKKSVDMWYNEISAYDFTKPGFSDATGHFTCLVWKSSSAFGMGLTIDTVSNKVDIAMNTSPPGNYLGEFAQNVLPLVSSPSPVPVPSPSPVPVPSPSPVPVPSPSPAPNPSPSPTDDMKQYLLTSLQNLLYIIRTNQPKYLIVNAINQIIYKINTSNKPQTTKSIVNGLYNVIYAVQRRRRNNVISGLVSNIVDSISSGEP